MVVVVGAVLVTVLAAACGDDGGRIESGPGSAARGGDDSRSSDDGGGAGGGAGRSAGVGGVVRSDDGGAVAGALVVPVSLDRPPNAVPELAVYTDAAGRYRWTLVPGTYDVTVTAAGRRATTKQVVVPPGEVAALDFALPAEL